MFARPLAVDAVETFLAELPRPAVPLHRPGTGRYRPRERLADTLRSLAVRVRERRPRSRASR